MKQVFGKKSRRRRRRPVHLHLSRREVQLRTSRLKLQHRLKLQYRLPRLKLQLRLSRQATEDGDRSGDRHRAADLLHLLPVLHQAGKISARSKIFLEHLDEVLEIISGEAEFRIFMKIFGKLCSRILFFQANTFSKLYLKQGDLSGLICSNLYCQLMALFKA